MFLPNTGKRQPIFFRRLANLVGRCTLILLTILRCSCIAQLTMSPRARRSAGDQVRGQPPRGGGRGSVADAELRVGCQSASQHRLAQVWPVEHLRHQPQHPLLQHPADGLRGLQLLRQERLRRQPRDTGHRQRQM